MPHDSYHRLESALRRFAERKEPGALLLRGEWGIGKTFACLNALKAKTGNDQISFSYVSLYGVSNLDEIYARVALGWNNAVTERVPGWLREMIGTSGREITKGVADIFHLGGIANAIGAAGMGLLAKNTLIVLDDLERRDDKLTVNAALGVVSYLVETRKCRVIFISNDDALQGPDKTAFASQKEKVFESEYVYQPSVAENAAVLADTNIKYLLPPLEALNLRNIRVMNRVNIFLNEFQDKLEKRNQRANEVVLKNAAILSILHHGFRSVINLSSRNTVNYLSAVFRQEGDPEATESDKLFAAAGFFEGPADDEIVEYLLTGNVEWGVLNEKLSHQEEYFKEQEVRNKLRGIFDKCYNNFIATTDEVTSGLEKLCDDYAELIEPTSLRAASEALIELGKSVHLQAWYDRWTAHNLPKLSDSDLRDTASGINFDPDPIREKAREEIVKRQGTPTIQGALTQRFGRNGYSPESIGQIAVLPDSEFQKWIETTDDPHVRSLVSAVLKDFYGKPPPEGAIAEKTLKAVDALAAKSVINRYRVRLIKKDAKIPRSNEGTP